MERGRQGKQIRKTLIENDGFYFFESFYVKNQGGSVDAGQTDLTFGFRSRVRTSGLSS